MSTMDVQALLGAMPFATACGVELDPDRVQGDVDTAGRGGHRGGVLLDRVAWSLSVGSA